MRYTSAIARLNTRESEICMGCPHCGALLLNQARYCATCGGEAAFAPVVQQPPPLAAERWGLVLAACLAAFAAFTMRSFFLYTQVIGRELNMSNQSWTWVILAFQAGLVVGSPLTGFLFDRLGVRWVAPIAIGIFSVAHATLAFVPGMEALVVSRFVLGLAVAAITPLIAVTIRSGLNPGSAAIGVALWLFTTKVAEAFWPIWSAEALRTLQNWRIPILATAAFGLVAAAIFLLAANDRTAPKHSAAPAPPVSASQWSILAMLFCAQIIMGALAYLQSQLVRFLIETRHVSYSGIIVPLIAGIAGMVGIGVGAGIALTQKTSAQGFVNAFRVCAWVGAAIVLAGFAMVVYSDAALGQGLISLGIPVVLVGLYTASVALAPEGFVGVTLGVMLGASVLVSVILGTGLAQSMTGETGILGSAAVLVAGLAGITSIAQGGDSIRRAE